MNSFKNIISLLLIIFAVSISINTIAQGPPPPPPDHGETGNVNGGNAPIGSGLFILMSMGAAYAGMKLYNKRKENIEE